MAKRTRWDVRVLLDCVERVKKEPSVHDPWAQIANCYEAKTGQSVNAKITCQRYQLLVRSGKAKARPFLGMMVGATKAAPPTIHPVDRAAAAIRSLVSFVIEEKLKSLEQNLLELRAHMAKIDKGLDERIRNVVNDMFS